LSKDLLENNLIQNVINDIAEVAGYLWEKGWAERNAGNISINITDLCTGDDHDLFADCPHQPFQSSYPAVSGNIFIITCAGSRMRDLSRRPGENICFIKVDSTTTRYAQICINSRQLMMQPSSELATHMAVHEMLVKKNTERKAVVHAHANELIALTHIPEFKSEEAVNRLLLKMHPETITFIPEGIGFIQYTLPGTEKIAQKTLKGLEKHQVIIWEKHGVLATGRDILDAFDTIDILVKSAKIYFSCRNAGFEPEGLTDSQLNEIRKAYT
jgi:rhamnulose-1-phosphate aldolase